MHNCARFKLGLLSATIITSTMIAGTMIATPALAQDAMADDTNSETSIIVTATRRNTTIMDTPINITALGAQALERERVDDIRDIADFTPGMTISDTGAGTTGVVVLRGLRASDVGDGGTNFDTALGIYMGEVPLYYDFKIIDIERVETLLGPQGTLYGLGTLAGAIRYIPNRPNTSEIEAEVHGRAYVKSESNQLGTQLDGMINIPIVRDHIAFRSATGYYYDPGFIDYPLLVREPGVSLTQPNGTESAFGENYDANLYQLDDLNFERTFSTRNQLLLQTSEDLKLILTYAYQRTRTDGAQSNGAGILGTGPYENASRVIEPVDRHAHLFSAEINANIADIVDLVATGAYTETKFRGQGDQTDLLLDLDYGYESFPAFVGTFDSDTTRKQKNAEIRFVSSHGGPLSWVIGGFYNENKFQSDFFETIPNHPFVDVETNPDFLEYVSYITSEVTEKAIFGESTFQITPQWQVTAGARYFDYTSSIAGAAALPVLGDPLSPYDLPVNGGEGGQDGWVWKFNTSYNITPDILFYATYSKGYRIGGPNRVAPCPADVADGDQIICALPSELQFGPDTTKNIELGLRAQLFDDIVTFNFNVYDIKWDGIQVASSTLFGATGITVNGGSAKSEGFETSFDLRPFSGLTIRGTYSYNNAELTEDVPGIIAIRTVPGDYSARPKQTQLDALAGDRLPGSAKNSGSLGATYVVPLDDADIVANWTATYRGNIVSRLGYDRAFGDLIPGYTTHRASLAYETDNYTVSLWANNIFDKYAVVSVANDRSRIGVNGGTVVRYYREAVLTPRTVGIEGRVRF